MKKHSIILTALALLAVSACGPEGTEYEQIPERINVGLLSDVELLPGYERFFVTGLTRYLSTAKTIKIELIDMDRTENATVDRTQDVFSYEVSGLAAGNYYVRLTSLDSEGNKSLSKTYNVNVYDASSAANYYPKRIVSASYDESNDQMVFSWNAVEEAQEIEFTYTTSSGEIVTEILPGDVQTNAISDWSDQCEVSAVTKVLPFKSAVDLLSTEPVSYVIPKVVINLPNTTFAEVQMPSDAAQGQYGGPTRQLWDGNFEWSNQGYHSNDGVGVPHHITFDLGVSAKLASTCMFFRAYGDFADWPPRRYQVWGHAEVEEGKSISDYDVFDAPDKDNGEFVAESEQNGWVLLKEGYPTQDQLEFDHKVDTDLECYTPVRYIRYRIVEGWKAPYTGPGMYGNMTEMNFKVLKGSVTPAN